MAGIDSYRLTGKHALVCGSTQGIGKACAMQFAELGASVTLFARDEAALKRVKNELPAGDGRAHSYLVADFNDPQRVAAEARRHIQETGPVHILLNNSGGPPHGPVTEATPQQFLDAFQRHVVCNQLLAQAVIPGMKQDRYGRIINIISTSVKEPIPGLGISNTTRWAVAAWAKTMAGELAPFGITVNNILPGFTATARIEELFKAKAKSSGVSEEQVRKEALARIPMGRLASADEIAAGAAFLASPAASYVTGINLPVDGGRTQSM
ncbi:MAG TPA: SDR family oxidoreductase [Phycisphaerae bacterium]|nr:SDR family oxidoreductase [Phycisphaerae bacterium]